MRYNVFMDENKERNLTVIEKTEIIEHKEIQHEKKLHSNPIAGKLMKFHHNKPAKFSVKDLFKK